MVQEDADSIITRRVSARSKTLSLEHAEYYCKSGDGTDEDLMRTGGYGIEMDYPHQLSELGNVFLKEEMEKYGVDFEKLKG